jgi:hypothetical protein
MVRVVPRGEVWLWRVFLVMVVYTVSEPAGCKAQGEQEFRRLHDCSTAGGDGTLKLSDECRLWRMLAGYRTESAVEYCKKGNGV